MYFEIGSKKIVDWLIPQVYANMLLQINKSPILQILWNNLLIRSILVHFFIQNSLNLMHSKISQHNKHPQMPPHISPLLLHHSHQLLLILTPSSSTSSSSSPSRTTNPKHAALSQKQPTSSSLFVPAAHVSSTSCGGGSTACGAHGHAED